MRFYDIQGINYRDKNHYYIHTMLSILCHMSIRDILSFKLETLLNWPKRKLIEALDKIRKKYNELEKQIREFKEENRSLKEENRSLKEENIRLKEELKHQRIQSVNKEVNKPSSKNVI